MFSYLNTTGRKGRVPKSNAPNRKPCDVGTLPNFLYYYTTPLLYFKENEETGRVISDDGWLPTGGTGGTV
jgi:hypothetical protein